MPFPAQGVQGAPNPGTDPNVVPYTSATVGVTTSATSIVTIPSTGAPVLITNGAQPIWLGRDNTVTAANSSGYPVAANASVLVTYGMFGLLNNDHVGGTSCTLYGISGTSTSTVTYIQATTWPGNE